MAALALAPEGLQTVELGTAYGGWKLPDGLLGRDSVCYCIGTGEDVSFDLALIERYGCTVRAIDPVERHASYVLGATAREPRFSFRQAALATRDGPIRMQAHHEQDSASVSAAGLYQTDSWTEVPGLTLATLMRDWDDQRIDLLKVDVEGLEYELLPTLDLVALGVTLFAVQLHQNGGVAGARRVIDGLRRQGFRAVAQRPVVKVTFYRPRG
jgi:FkbM family methyltransferase